MHIPSEFDKYLKTNRRWDRQVDYILSIYISRPVQPIYITFTHHIHSWHIYIAGIKGIVGKVDIEGLVKNIYILYILKDCRTIFLNK